MAKSVVSIVKGTNVEEMVEESLSLLGGVHSLIKPGSVVVIKPNAGHAFPPETSVNTSPAMVEAVIRELRKAEPREIIVAESSAIGCDTLECLEISGIENAAKEAGADRVVDIKRETDLIKMPIRDARSEISFVLLPRFLVEADHIVNLPIFKTHVSMVFSCALKNLKGVVQDKVHYKMHQTDLAAAMMDLWSVVKADLSIVDAIRPAEGFGPHTGIPTDLDCIVAGKDPVAVDATLCRMVGLDIKKVPYFKAASERGLGNFNERFIETRGRKIEEVFKKLWIPYLGGFDQWPEYKIYSENSCSSCQGLMAYSMEKLKALGEYDKNAGMTIVFGRKKEIPKGVSPEDLLLVGDCVKKFRDKGIWVEGCPPGEPRPCWAIIDRTANITGNPRKRMESETPAFMDYMKKMRAQSK